MRAGDKTGFIVNRLLVPYMLDAIRALEEGVGSIVDIDTSMKLGWVIRWVRLRWRFCGSRYDLLHRGDHVQRVS